MDYCNSDIPALNYQYEVQSIEIESDIVFDGILDGEFADEFAEEFTEHSNSEINVDNTSVREKINELTSKDEPISTDTEKCESVDNSLSSNEIKRKNDETKINESAESTPNKLTQNIVPVIRKFTSFDKCSKNSELISKSTTKINESTSSCIPVIENVFTEINCNDEFSENPQSTLEINELAQKINKSTDSCIPVIESVITCTNHKESGFDFVPENASKSTHKINESIPVIQNISTFKDFENSVDFTPETTLTSTNEVTGEIVQSTEEINQSTDTFIPVIESYTTCSDFEETSVDFTPGIENVQTCSDFDDTSRNVEDFTPVIENYCSVPNDVDFGPGFDVRNIKKEIQENGREMFESSFESSEATLELTFEPLQEERDVKPDLVQLQREIQLSSKYAVPKPGRGRPRKCKTRPGPRSKTRPMSAPIIRRRSTCSVSSTDPDDYQIKPCFVRLNSKEVTKYLKHQNKRFIPWYLKKSNFGGSIADTVKSGRRKTIQTSGKLEPQSAEFSAGEPTLDPMVSKKPRQKNLDGYIIKKKNPILLRRKNKNRFLLVEEQIENSQMDIVKLLEKCIKPKSELSSPKNRKKSINKMYSSVASPEKFIDMLEKSKLLKDKFGFPLESQPKKVKVLYPKKHSYTPVKNINELMLGKPRNLWPNSIENILFSQSANMLPNSLENQTSNLQAPSDITSHIPKMYQNVIETPEISPCTGNNSQSLQQNLPKSPENSLNTENLSSTLKTSEIASNSQNDNQNLQEILSSTPVILPNQLITPEKPLNNTNPLETLPSILKTCESQTSNVPKTLGTQNLIQCNIPLRGPYYPRYNSQQFVLTSNQNIPPNAAQCLYCKKVFINVDQLLHHVQKEHLHKKWEPDMNTESDVDSEVSEHITKNVSKFMTIIMDQAILNLKSKGALPLNRQIHNQELLMQSMEGSETDSVSESQDEENERRSEYMDQFNTSKIVEEKEPISRKIHLGNISGPKFPIIPNNIQFGPKTGPNCTITSEQSIEPDQESSYILEIPININASQYPITSNIETQIGPKYEPISTITSDQRIQINIEPHHTIEVPINSEIGPICTTSNRQLETNSNYENSDIDPKIGSPIGKITKPKASMSSKVISISSICKNCGKKYCIDVPNEKILIKLFKQSVFSKMCLKCGNMVQTETLKPENTAVKKSRKRKANIAKKSTSKSLQVPKNGSFTFCDEKERKEIGPNLPKPGSFMFCDLNEIAEENIGLEEQSVTSNPQISSNLKGIPATKRIKSPEKLVAETSATITICNIEEIASKNLELESAKSTTTKKTQTSNKNQSQDQYSILREKNEDLVIDKTLENPLELNDSGIQIANVTSLQSIEINQNQYSKDESKVQITNITTLESTINENQQDNSELQIKDVTSLATESIINTGESEINHGNELGIEISGVTSLAENELKISDVTSLASKNQQEESIQIISITTKDKNNSTNKVEISKNKEIECLTPKNIKSREIVMTGISKDITITRVSELVKTVKCAKCKTVITNQLSSGNEYTVLCEYCIKNHCISLTKSQVSPEYKCPKCYENVISAKGLQNHLKDVHKTIVSLVKCKLCKKYCVNMNDLKRHIKVFHIYIHACKYCPLRFADNIPLFSHIQKSHQSQPLFVHKSQDSEVQIVEENAKKKLPPIQDSNVKIAREKVKKKLSSIQDNDAQILEEKAKKKLPPIQDNDVQILEEKAEKKLPPIQDNDLQILEEKAKKQLPPIQDNSIEVQNSIQSSGTVQTVVIDDDLRLKKAIENFSEDTKNSKEMPIESSKSVSDIQNSTNIIDESLKEVQKTSEITSETDSTCNKSSEIIITETVSDLNQILKTPEENVECLKFIDTKDKSESIINSDIDFIENDFQDDNDIQINIDKCMELLEDSNSQLETDTIADTYKLSTISSEDTSKIDSKVPEITTEICNSEISSQVLELHTEIGTLAEKVTISANCEVDSKVSKITSETSSFSLEIHPKIVETDPKVPGIITEKDISETKLINNEPLLVSSHELVPVDTLPKTSKLKKQNGDKDELLTLFTELDQEFSINSTTPESSQNSKENSSNVQKKKRQKRKQTLKAIEPVLTEPTQTNTAKRQRKRKRYQDFEYDNLEDLETVTPDPQELDLNSKMVLLPDESGTIIGTEEKVPKRKMKMKKKTEIIPKSPHSRGRKGYSNKIADILEKIKSKKRLRVYTSNIIENEIKKDEKSTEISQDEELIENSTTEMKKLKAKHSSKNKTSMIKIKAFKNSMKNEKLNKKKIKIKFYSCNYCKSTFTNPMSFKSHLKEHCREVMKKSKEISAKLHPNESKIQPTRNSIRTRMKCENCERYFSTPNKLNNHACIFVKLKSKVIKRAVRINSNFNCQMCMLQFKSKRKLEKHFRTDHFLSENHRNSKKKIKNASKNVFKTDIYVTTKINQDGTIEYFDVNVIEPKLDQDLVPITEEKTPEDVNLFPDVLETQNNTEIAHNMDLSMNSLLEKQVGQNMVPIVESENVNMDQNEISPIEKQEDQNMEPITATIEESIKVDHNLDLNTISKKCVTEVDSKMNHTTKTQDSLSVDLISDSKCISTSLLEKQKVDQNETEILDQIAPSNNATCETELIDSVSTIDAAQSIHDSPSTLPSSESGKNDTKIVTESLNLDSNEVQNSEVPKIQKKKKKRKKQIPWITKKIKTTPKSTCKQENTKLESSIEDSKLNPNNTDTSPLKIRRRRKNKKQMEIENENQVDSKIESPNSSKVCTYNTRRKSKVPDGSQNLSTSNPQIESTILENTPALTKIKKKTKIQNVSLIDTKELDSPKSLNSENQITIENQKEIKEKIAKNDMTMMESVNLSSKLTPESLHANVDSDLGTKNKNKSSCNVDSTMTTSPESSPSKVGRKCKIKKLESESNLSPEFPDSEKTTEITEKSSCNEDSTMNTSPESTASPSKVGRKRKIKKVESETNESPNFPDSEKTTEITEKTSCNEDSTMNTSPSKVGRKHKNKKLESESNLSPEFPDSEKTTEISEKTSCNEDSTMNPSPESMPSPSKVGRKCKIKKLESETNASPNFPDSEKTNSEITEKTSCNDDSTMNTSPSKVGRKRKTIKLQSETNSSSNFPDSEKTTETTEKTSCNEDSTMNTSPSKVGRKHKNKKLESESNLSPEFPDSEKTTEISEKTSCNEDSTMNPSPESMPSPSKVGRKCKIKKLESETNASPNFPDSEKTNSEITEKTSCNEDSTMNTSPSKVGRKRKTIKLQSETNSSSNFPDSEKTTKISEKTSCNEDSTMTTSPESMRSPSKVGRKCKIKKVESETNASPTFPDSEKTTEISEKTSCNEDSTMTTSPESTASPSKVERKCKVKKLESETNSFPNFPDSEKTNSKNTEKTSCNEDSTMTTSPESTASPLKVGRKRKIKKVESESNSSPNFPDSEKTTEIAEKSSNTDPNLDLITSGIPQNKDTKIVSSQFQNKPKRHKMLTLDLLTAVLPQNEGKNFIPTEILNRTKHNRKVIKKRKFKSIIIERYVNLIQSRNSETNSIPNKASNSKSDKNTKNIQCDDSNKNSPDSKYNTRRNNKKKIAELSNANLKKSTNSNHENSQHSDESLSTQKSKKIKFIQKYEGSESCIPVIIQEDSSSNQNLSDALPENSTQNMVQINEENVKIGKKKRKLKNLKSEMIVSDDSEHKNDSINPINNVTELEPKIIKKNMKRKTANEEILPTNHSKLHSKVNQMSSNSGPNSTINPYTKSSIKVQNESELETGSQRDEKYKITTQRKYEGLIRDPILKLDAKPTAKMFMNDKSFKIASTKKLQNKSEMGPEVVKKYKKKGNKGSIMPEIQEFLKIRSEITNSEISPETTETFPKIKIGSSSKIVKRNVQNTKSATEISPKITEILAMTSSSSDVFDNNVSKTVTEISSDSFYESASCSEIVKNTGIQTFTETISETPLVFTTTALTPEIIKPKDHTATIITETSLKTPKTLPETEVASTSKHKVCMTKSNSEINTETKPVNSETHETVQTEAISVNSEITGNAKSSTESSKCSIM